MTGDAVEDVGESSLGIDVIHLCGDDQAVHEGGPLAAAVRSGEQRIASPELLLDFEPLPHLICSRRDRSARDSDEEGEHGEEGGAGGGDKR